MSKKDFKDNLGTIARSGTKNFLSKMSGDAKKDSNLIGQFGVGFYSCFMVADKVDVISKKAGQKQAHKWTSDGKSGYEIVTDKTDETGTTIILHLNDEGKEFASRWKIESTVKKYSDHIDFPIFLSYLITSMIALLFSGLIIERYQINGFLVGVYLTQVLILVILHIGLLY